ncbi:unnamed protein product, partial [Symbiodinium necroappetens]
MSRHLQSHVWVDSAYSLEIVKSTRWHLGSCGRAEGVWKDIMSVNKAKQVCFIQRIHFHFQVRRRQVKAAVHARMNQELWDSTLEGVCFLVWVLDAMRAARTDDGAALLFAPDVLRSCFQKVLEGDYTAEAEKHCLLRLAEDCREQFTKLDQESIQKTFEADCYKLTWDLSAFATHVDSLTKNKKTAQLAKVCHVRAEMKRGSNTVVNFIEKNSPHDTALYKDRDTCENIKKASTPPLCLSKTDTPIMAGILIVPVLSSSRVGSGIRGEIRRLEDKLDAKFLDNVSINIRMGEPHNNKKHALLYPAMVCWASGTSENIFQTSKLVVDRSHSEAQEAAQHLGGLHMPQVDNTIVKYSERLVAQFLLEDWKTGNNLIGASSFQPDPPAADLQGPADPTFNLCALTRNAEGNLAITLPPGIRTKWSEDSARKEDWGKLLAKFGPHDYGSIRYLHYLRYLYYGGGRSRAGPVGNANVTLKITPAVEKNREQAANACEGQVHKLFLVANSDVTLPKNEYQLAHDRASFLSGQKVQKLMEQGASRMSCGNILNVLTLLLGKSWGPRRRFAARALFSFMMGESDNSGDLMAFLMSSHSSMPAAAMNAASEAGASSANTSNGGLSRTVTPPPVKRQLSFGDSRTAAGPYRRGATLDSDMGQTPKGAMRTPPAAKLLLESPQSTPRASSDDPALKLEIDAVSQKLQAELKLEKEKKTKKDVASKKPTGKKATE